MANRKSPSGSGRAIAAVTERVRAGGDLGLAAELQKAVRVLERRLDELDARGLAFHPPVYLSDQWGCPDGTPIIGVPFYLADPKLGSIEKAVDALETSRQIMMYMRHEAGHVFNYAYRLYTTPEWRRLFGPFFRQYRDDYKPVPFSRDYVRHIEGWYAQKHPDEDFAETFAVWLTPGSRWRRRYRGWPALRKLRYVDRVARAVGKSEPPVRIASTDITVEEMDMTVEEFFQANAAERAPVEVALENDLPDLFLRRGRRRRGVRPAVEMIREHRATLVNKIEYWTGVRRSVLRALVERIEETAEQLDLRVLTKTEAATLVELTAYATTLSMNYLTRGAFVPRARRLRRGSRLVDGRRPGEEAHGPTADRDRPRP